MSTNLYVDSYRLLLVVGGLWKKLLELKANSKYIIKQTCALLFELRI